MIQYALLLYNILDHQLIEDSELYQIAYRFNPDFAATLTYEVIIPLKEDARVGPSDGHHPYLHQERPDLDLSRSGPFSIAQEPPLKAIP